MQAVEVRDLEVTYGDVQAVKGISFDVQLGELVVLVGANGAGKTSTLETIEGYRTPTSGSVSLFGNAPSRALAEGRVGVLLQDDGIYPAAKVREVIDLFRALHGNTGRSTDELIELVGLERQHTSAVRRLSGGEHRRLALALALTGQPELLLLDEPTAGVDADGAVVVAEVLTAIRDAGGGVLITTHDIDLAERIADRVVVMAHGHIVADGTVAELTQAESERTKFTTITPVPATALDDLSGRLGLSVHTIDAGYAVDAARTTSLIGELSEWATAHSIELDHIGHGRTSLAAAIADVTNDTATMHHDSGPAA